MEGTIRLERYIWMARSSSCFPTNRYTMYFRVPSDIKHELRDRYDIDLSRDWKKMAVETLLAEEVVNGSKEVVIIHKIRKLPGVK